MSNSSINKIIGEYKVDFATNATSGTIVSYPASGVVSPIIPSNRKKTYLISVENPNAASDVSVYFYVKETFNGNTRWSNISSILIPKTPTGTPVNTAPHPTNCTSVRSILLQGAMLGQGMGFAAKLESNITAGFSLRVVIREVE